MSRRRGYRRPVDFRGWVAVILAVGLAGTSMGFVTVSATDIMHENATYGLSENLTQVLVALTGGIIGILGAYIGAGTLKSKPEKEEEETDDGDNQG
jgi:hypothetical protein